MRALCEFGAAGAEMGDLIQLMVKQKECQVEGDSSTSRKYIGKILRSDQKLFVKVCVKCCIHD